MKKKKTKKKKNKNNSLMTYTDITMGNEDKQFSQNAINIRPTWNEFELEILSIIY